MPDVQVTFRTGNYSEYDNTQYEPGCLYYLKDETSTPHRYRIFLNGNEYQSFHTSSEIKVTARTGNYAVGDTISVGADLETLIKNMLSKDINPTAISPAVSLSNVGWTGAKEVGTQFTPTYTASLSGGTYRVATDDGNIDQAGGVTASAWSVSATASGTTPSTFTAKTTASGNFGTVTLGDNASFSVTATATGTQGNMPKTYLGSDYPSIRFAAGATYSKSSAAATSYRAYFYGYAQNASTDYAALTGAQIRSLDKAGTTKRSTPVTSVTVPLSSGAGMQQMYFAAPHSAGYTSVTVKSNDTGLPQTVTKYPSTVTVAGANNYTGVAYDVWYIKNSSPSSASETYAITWTK